jgi:2-methylisocitrate lyase-like PEP mutase family enzyme
MSKSAVLRELLASPDTLVMPDAYDPLSARIIERLGFKAVQCSGYSFALAACCPSEATFGFERNLALTKSIVEAVPVPVMADGEDGFGDPPVVAETVRAFIRAGVAGINIEDQVLGQPAPKRVVDRGLMIEKIRAAREAARDEGLPDLILNGRTDALSVAANRNAGLNESIARANLYLQAGADLAFVTGVATIVEVKTLVQGIHGPVRIAAGLANNINTMSIADLRTCGVRRVSLPVVAIFSVIQAVSRTPGREVTGHQRQRHGNAYRLTAGACPRPAPGRNKSNPIALARLTPSSFAASVTVIVLRRTVAKMPRW